MMGPAARCTDAVRRCMVAVVRYTASLQACGHNRPLLGKGMPKHETPPARLPLHAPWPASFNALRYYRTTRTHHMRTHPSRLTGTSSCPHRARAMPVGASARRPAPAPLPPAISAAWCHCQQHMCAWRLATGEMDGLGKRRKKQQQCGKNRMHSGTTHTHAGGLGVACHQTHSHDQGAVAMGVGQGPAACIASDFSSGQGACAAAGAAGAAFHCYARAIYPAGCLGSRGGAAGCSPVLAAHHLPLILRLVLSADVGQAASPPRVACHTKQRHPCLVSLQRSAEGRGCMRRRVRQQAAGKGPGMVRSGFGEEGVR